MPSAQSASDGKYACGSQRCIIHVLAVLLQEPKHIHPFNEPARDLRVHNVPLWLWQRDLLSRYFSEEREYGNLRTAREQEGDVNRAALVHKDDRYTKLFCILVGHDVRG